MKRKLWWVLANSFLLLMFYCGAIVKLNAAWNIFVFLIWFDFIAKVILLLSKTNKLNNAACRRSVNKYAVYIFDVGVVLSLAAMGQFLLAAIFTVSSFIEIAIYDVDAK